MNCTKAITYLAVLAMAVMVIDAASGDWSTYGAAAFSFLALRIVMAALNRPVKLRTLATPSYAVVVTAYNEDPGLLRRCLQSLLGQVVPPVSVVVVDDGSTLPVTIGDLEVEFKRRGVALELVRFPSNQGKREALAAGFRSSPPVAGIVTVDSDAVLAPDACAHLANALTESRVMAACGRVTALNRTHNLLTRVLDVRYTAAFDVERASQSPVGAMMCCCGALAIYRRTIILAHLDEFLGQTFLGKPAAFGDDRRLTAICLREGRTMYVAAATGYTAVPERLGHFLRQQVRWSKSWMRETWLALVEQPLRRPALWVAGLEAVVWVTFTVALVFAIATAAFGLLWEAMLLYLAVASVMAMARATPYAFRADLTVRARMAGVACMPLYTLMHITLMLGVRAWALATIKDNGWGTRQRVETQLVN